MEILVLYYSATGSVRALAQSLSRGVESVEGMHARVDSGFWGALSRNPHWKREEGALWARAAEQGFRETRPAVFVGESSHFRLYVDPATGLLLIFAFWELTSLTSFLLIGFDHQRPVARAAQVADDHHQGAIARVIQPARQSSQPDPGPTLAIELARGALAAARR